MQPSIHFLLLGTAALAAGCASAEPSPADSAAAPAARVVSGTLTLDGSEYEVDWFVPTAAAPRALVTVQHGFARQCANVRQTGLQIASGGLLGLCVNASMAGGNPALADALAAALLSGITAPGGQPLPERIAVGGHSAGGYFASRVGWNLATLAPQRLAGALLWDPVTPRADFTAQLAAISQAGQRPVLAVVGAADGCNAQGNAWPALRQVQQDAIAAGNDGFVGLQLLKNPTHVDVEGRDTDTLATLACGTPRRPNSEALRTLSARWAADMADGVRSRDAYPGGAYVDGLVGSGRAQVFE